MPKYIIALNPYCYAFQNELKQYIQITGQPQERFMDLYKECVSQIFSKMHRDLQTFTYAILELPNWITINYTAEPIDYDQTVFFREGIRTFAMLLWRDMQQKTDFEREYFYLVESCSLNTAVIAAYVDSGQL